MRRGGLLMFPGFALVGIGFLGVPLGCFPGMMTMLYAACCGSFLKSHQKPGMWLFALAFGVGVVPLYIVLTWVGVASAPGRAWQATDLLLGTTMLGMTVKLLISVFIYNRLISRTVAAMRRDEAQPAPAADAAPPGAPSSPPSAQRS